MRRITTIISLLLCTIAPFAVHAAVPADFSRLKELTPHSPQTGREIAAITLDVDMYAASRDDLGDLRIFRAGAAVPHVTERVSENCSRTVRRSQPARKVSLHEDAANRLEVVFELLGETPRSDGLEIVTPLRDYERGLRISASPDGKEWTVIVPEAQVFDYTRYMDIAQREAAFPSTAGRFIKLEIFQADDAKTAPILELTREFRKGQAEGEIQKTTVEKRPFRMDDVRFWRTSVVEEFKADIKRDYPVAGWKVCRDEKGKATIVEVKTRREPLTALRLTTDSANFCRTVEIQVPRGGAREEWAPARMDEWYTLATGTVSNLSFRTVCRSALAVDFPETRAAEYRLVIHDGDNPPLHVTGVAGRGNVYRAVFLAESAIPHVLYYGAPLVLPPVYDAAVVLGQLRSDYRPAAWTAGPEKMNPEHKSDGRSGVHGFFARKLVFGSILALVVAVLAFALIRAVRHAESATDGGKED